MHGMTNGNSGGNVAGTILATLCCLYLCREATRPDEVVVVEERTVITPGRPPRKYTRRKRRYRDRRGFYDGDDPTVIVVNAKGGEKQDSLPLVACKQNVITR